MSPRTVSFVLAMTFKAMIGLVGSEALAGSYVGGHNKVDTHNFHKAYPRLKNTRVDVCTTCHPGGRHVHKGETLELESCEYCHRSYGYRPPHGKLPLNRYGLAYRDAGRTAAALRTIGRRDSDGDGIANEKELRRRSFPGDSADRPARKLAPAWVLPKARLLRLPQHRQVFLVNCTRRDDFYADYTGIRLADLLDLLRARPEARSVTLYSADGYTVRFPLRSRVTYAVGTWYFPLGKMFHEPWVKRPAKSRYAHQEQLRGSGYVILAHSRDGKSMPVARLNRRGRLKGEGPWRVVTPQVRRTGPDQPSKRAYPGHPRPYDPANDHNSDWCGKSVVAVRVDPAPPGMREPAWERRAPGLMRKGRLVVWGAIEGPKGLRPVRWR